MIPPIYGVKQGSCSSSLFPGSQKESTALQFHSKRALTLSKEVTSLFPETRSTAECYYKGVQVTRIRQSQRMHRLPFVNSTRHNIAMLFSLGAEGRVTEPFLWTNTVLAPPASMFPWVDKPEKKCSNNIMNRKDVKSISFTYCMLTKTKGNRWWWWRWWCR